MKKLNSLFALKVTCGPLVLAVAFLTLLPSSAQADGPDGAKLYVSANCVACHQANGAGIPATYPALMGNPLVAGDPDTIIKIILIGPEKVLPPGSPKFAGQMPPITGMSDAKIAAIVTYIRDKFGNGASPVDEDEVAKVKAALPK